MRFLRSPHVGVSEGETGQEQKICGFFTDFSIVIEISGFTEQIRPRVPPTILLQPPPPAQRPQVLWNVPSGNFQPTVNNKRGQLGKKRRKYEEMYSGQYTLVVFFEKHLIPRS